LGLKYARRNEIDGQSVAIDYTACDLKRIGNEKLQERYVGELAFEKYDLDLLTYLSK